MDKCVFAGSFDPITLGHIEIIKTAVKTYKEVVVGVLENWDKKYYFTPEERLEMTKDACKDISGVTVKYYAGTLVDFLKQEKTNIFVRGIRNQKDLEYENSCKLYHTRFMPDIRYVYVSSFKNKEVSSTIVKQKFLNGEDISNLVPKCVLKYFTNR